MTGADSVHTSDEPLQSSIATSPTLLFINQTIGLVTVADVGQRRTTKAQEKNALEKRQNRENVAITDMMQKKKPKNQKTYKPTKNKSCNCQKHANP